MAYEILKKKDFPPQPGLYKVKTLFLKGRRYPVNEEVILPVGTKDFPQVKHMTLIEALGPCPFEVALIDQKIENATNEIKNAEEQIVVLEEKKVDTVEAMEVKTLKADKKLELKKELEAIVKELESFNGVLTEQKAVLKDAKAELKELNGKEYAKGITRRRTEKRPGSRASRREEFLKKNS